MVLSCFSDAVFSLSLSHGKISSFHACFQFWEQQQKVGVYVGWGMITVLFLAKKLRTITGVRIVALSDRWFHAQNIRTNCMAWANHNDDHLSNFSNSDPMTLHNNLLHCFSTFIGCWCARARPQRVSPLKPSRACTTFLFKLNSPNSAAHIWIDLAALHFLFHTKIKKCFVFKLRNFISCPIAEQIFSLWGKALGKPSYIRWKSKIIVQNCFALTQSLYMFAYKKFLTILRNFKWLRKPIYL